MMAYRGHIQVQRVDNDEVLGLIGPDTNYWTPFVDTAALQITFSLLVSATSGSQLQLQQLVSRRFSAYG
jgi:hypothetical protein